MKYKSEHQIQQMVWLWFYENYPQYRLPPVGSNPRCLLVHNYNNPRSMVAGSKLVSCGLTKGFPDLTLYVPSLLYHGLHIELKQPGEKASKEQKEVHEALRSQGYAVEVCDNHEVAIEAIMNYLIEAIK